MPWPAKAMIWLSVLLLLSPVLFVGAAFVVALVTFDDLPDGVVSTRDLTPEEYADHLARVSYEPVTSWSPADLELCYLMETAQYEYGNNGTIHADMVRLLQEANNPRFVTPDLMTATNVFLLGAYHGDTERVSGHEFGRAAVFLLIECAAGLNAAHAGNLGADGSIRSRGGDLDCTDVSGRVWVGNDDPNNLDGDGDGWGCE